jgi:hypothetical protein
MEYIERCLKINPDNVEALLAKAISNKDKAIARLEVDELVKRYPKYYRLYLEMGFLIENNIE